MQPAKVELEAAINATEFHTPKCPVYQNVDAMPHTDPAEIKRNLVAQLTASVRWTQTVKNMVADGATDFTECGPGAVLQGLIKKIDSHGNGTWHSLTPRRAHRSQDTCKGRAHPRVFPFLLPGEEGHDTFYGYCYHSYAFREGESLFVPWVPHVQQELSLPLL